jgi:hypothetical protein
LNWKSKIVKKCNTYSRDFNLHQLLQIPVFFSSVRAPSATFQRERWTPAATGIAASFPQHPGLRILRPKLSVGETAD